MTDSEKNAMRFMRSDGYTLQEVADVFGISRERVRQILGNRSYEGTLKKSYENIPFIGLRDYIAENKLSVAELCKMLGFVELNGSRSYLASYLRGEHEMKMGMIDKLIEITGLPYETLFRKE